MSKKQTTKKAPAPKLTNLDRLDYILSATKKDATYKKHLAHIRTVLAPIVKGTVIKEILALHRKGLSNQEIVAAGYNKITVSRQVKEYKTKTTYAIDVAKGNVEIDDEESEE